jgi:hypothetical protein
MKIQQVNRIIGDFSLPSVSTFDDKFRVVLSHIPLTFIPGIFSREVNCNTLYQWTSNNVLNYIGHAPIET